MIRLTGVLALFLSSAQGDLQVEPLVQSKDPVYEASLPSGYKPVLAAGTPSIYRRSSGPEDWAKLTLTLTPATQGMAQPPREVTEADLLPFVILPTDSKRTFTVTRWKDVYIGTLEYRAVVDNLRVYGLTGVVPIAGKAVTLSVSAPDPLEAEVKKDFRATLAKLSGATRWLSPETLEKAGKLERVGQAGAGLALLYLIAWAALFRGHPMAAHWVRVIWLVAIAVLFFIPMLSPGDATLFSNLLVNSILPLAFLLFAARRVKMGIE